MKKLVTVVMVAAFALSAGSALAGSEACTVDGVEGDKVTMTCKGTALKAGDAVKVKAKKAAKVEGC